MAASTQPPDAPQDAAEPTGTGPARDGDPLEQLARLEVENASLRAACEKLAACRDRERELFDLAPFGYALVDAWGCILTANRTLAEMVGERQDALPGVSLAHLVVEPDGPRLAVHVARVLSSGRHDRCLVRLRRPDGPPLPVRVDSQVVSGSTSSDPVRIWCAMSSREGPALAQGEAGVCAGGRPPGGAPLLDDQLLAQLSNELDEGVFYRDHDGSVTLVSEQCAAIWGQPPVALTGKGLDRGIHDVELDPADRPEPGATRRYRVARPDGGSRAVRERTIPVRDEHGRAVGVLGLVRDLTADREREERILHQRRMETLGMFASGIAHDFANVVMGIQGRAHAARDANGDTLAEMLHDIDRAADHGGSLVRRLLVFARKQRAERSPMGADASIGRSVDLVQRLMGRAVGIELTAGAPGMVVVTDQVELDQIVMNLATNARDAMPAGGVIRVRTERVAVDRTQARVLCVSPGPFVRIVVEDTGVGMDAPTRQRVFERYFTTKPPGLGTGLGLSTVRAIAAELHGAVTVESEKGAGTTVSVLLPAVDV